MTFEFTATSAEKDPRRKTFTEALTRDFNNQLNAILADCPGSLPDPEIYKDCLDRISEKLKLLSPEHIDEIEELISTIANTELKDNETFGSYAAEKLVSYILKHYDYSEIEAISREGRDMLNRLVEYEVDDETDEVRLHIPMTLLENGLELKKLFIEALQVLAKKLKQDPDLQSIKQVFAASWIIYRTKDEHLEKLGFTNIERYEKDQTGSAVMSREIILDKYGSDWISPSPLISGLTPGRP